MKNDTLVDLSWPPLVHTRGVIFNSPRFYLKCIQVARESFCRRSGENFFVADPDLFILLKRNPWKLRERFPWAIATGLFLYHEPKQLEGRTQHHYWFGHMSLFSLMKFMPRSPSILRISMNSQVPVSLFSYCYNLRNNWRRWWEGTYS